MFRIALLTFRGSKNDILIKIFFSQTEINDYYGGRRAEHSEMVEIFCAFMVQAIFKTVDFAIITTIFLKASRKTREIIVEATRRDLVPIICYYFIICTKTKKNMGPAEKYFRKKFPVEIAGK